MDTQGRDRKRRILISGVLVVCACLVGLVDVGQAQVQTGSILGAVKDESQGALPGVTATLTSPALPAGPATVVTDERGQYRFADLPPGAYTLKLELPGFSNYAEEGLRVGVGGTTQRDVTLKVGTLTETITVSGESPMVDTRKSSVGANLSAEVIEAIPTQAFSRADFEKFIPGMNVASLSQSNHGGNSMGSPSAETSRLIDGAQGNHPGSGVDYSIGNVDAIEEIQATTLGASAEYQIAQGGVINAVIKSGTNQFKGTVRYFSSPDAVTSKPLKLPCNCSLGETGFTNKQWVWGVYAGGPIVENRAWFFGAVGDEIGGGTQPGIDPSLANPPSTGRVVGKVTWQINNGLRFSGTFHDDLWTVAGLPTRATPFNATTKAAGSIPVYALEVTKTFANTILTARGSGWYFLNRRSFPLSGDRITPYRLDQRSGIATGGVVLMAQENGGRHMLAFKVNHFARTGRIQHDLGFGAQEEIMFERIFQAWPSGVQYYDLGTAPDYALFREASSLAAAANTQGGWGEDQMTLGRLTLSLGLRFDRMEGVSRDLPKVDNQFKETGTTIAGLGHMFTWTNTWSPRVGFNIKLTGDAKTILRGTYGRYYRTIFLNDFTGVHPGILPVTEAKFDPATGGYTTIVSVTNTRDNITVDPNMIAPSTDQYSIGLDRELMRNVAVTVSYVHKYGKNAVGWRDIGGVYGERTEVLPNGQTLTVYPLLNSPRQRLFQATNGPGFYNRYDGLILSLTKRLSQRWQGGFAYTLSKSEGIQGSGALGQDPNDLTNLDGRLVVAQDRPHSVKGWASYIIPRVDAVASISILDFSGLPFAPQALVSLPQGRRSINIAPPGTYRNPRVHMVEVTFDKTLVERGGRRLAIMAQVFNVLQNQTWETRITTNFFSPNFAKPSTWAPTRRLGIGVKAQF